MESRLSSANSSYDTVFELTLLLEVMLSTYSDINKNNLPIPQLATLSFSL